MNATTSPKPRQSGPLASLSGTVKLLQAIGAVGKPEHRTGEIEVVSQTKRGPVTRRYFICCGDRGYSLFSYDNAKKQNINYDLPADLSSCECMEFLNRADKREDHQCKHQKAIASLISRGKLPAVPVCSPVHEDVEADELADTWGWEDAEADAYLSRWDAA